ncbi:exonuclease SbcCD subunit D [Nesterenkonia sp. HG001]|uniref:exonuclease SbcCD subunit D n=1 Tax=Nesterenkonia sp. HG001 TaxID=2983207 RepID=UPI002AC44E43|nr:exonuclease SbcCD subunit D [Nesterenkonia sp. HG001]MDZ5078608.1 exonuclease SbcCD subunit D [Nesterenkonia sp. HG001]
MRWLHTSDWHLGRGFHGTSLVDAQQEMLDTVCRTVEDQRVDVVLVAGDVYDRALPPEWAVSMLERCLLRLADAGVTVIITSGNHDSAQRLGFGRGLMAASGVHLRTSLEDAWTPVTLDDGEEVVLVYGVPYLEPQLYASRLGLGRVSHTALMEEVIRRIQADVDRRRQEICPGVTVRTVLMAHLFAAHGVGSDSERAIGVEAPSGEPMEHSEESSGGLAVVPLSLFEGFDYTALGHLHGRQRLAPQVRYSGSPLRYSFSEARQAKGAWLWDSTDWSAITGLDWHIGRDLAQLRGALEEILDEPTVRRHREDFVQVTVTDVVRPERAFQRVQEAYPHLATFAHRPPQEPGAAAGYAEALHQAETPGQVVDSFLEHVRGRGPGEEEQEILTEALAAVRVDLARTGGPAPEEGTS